MLNENFLDDIMDLVGTLTKSEDDSDYAYKEIEDNLKMPKEEKQEAKDLLAEIEDIHEAIKEFSEKSDETYEFLNAKYMELYHKEDKTDKDREEQADYDDKRKKEAEKKKQYLLKQKKAIEDKMKIVNKIQAKYKGDKDDDEE